MASTRLNSNHRSLLIALMERVVDCPVEQKAEQTTYDKALPVARKLVEAAFPPSDMAVFRKYEQARQDRCVRFQVPDGSVMQFEFRADDAPWIPSRGNCSSRLYIADEKQGAALEKWKDAAQNFKKALEQKKTDYRNFINSSATFEQVIAVWPEAEQVASQIRENLPAAINPEVLARITADSQKRMKRAA